MNFIDIHNHIIAGVDDGAKTRDETISFLKMAERENISKLILTPHFKEQVFENTREVLENKCQELNQIIKEENLKVEIYPGSEIFLSNKTLSLLNNGKLQTMNSSDYVLVETVFYQQMATIDLQEELYNLKVDGYRAILAHPERYEMTHQDINTIYDLVREGHYMQINVNSLYSHHPNHKIVKKLLNHHLVHFVATDAHDLIHRPLKLAEGYLYVQKHYGKKMAEELFYLNPLKVIKNEKIEPEDYSEIKTKRFLLF